MENGHKYVLAAYFAALNDYVVAMLTIDPLTKARATLSVAVNGIFLPVPAVVEQLQRFCRPLAFHNDGYDHDISFSGSCLLVRHYGRNLLVCTRHQLTNAGRASNEIIIVVDRVDGRGVGINPNEVSQAILDPSIDPTYSDLADIMIAEFASRRPDREIESHFLVLDLASAPDFDAVEADSIDAIFSISYPTVDASCDTTYDDDYRIVGVDVVSRWSKMYFNMAEPTAWDGPGLVPLDPATEDQILTEPDGISGAPVFFIRGIKSGLPELGFAGIIARGNKQGRINIIAAAQIRQVLDLHINPPLPTKA